MVPPPTEVRIAGTKVPLTFSVYARFTGRDIKEMILSRFGLPISRQTLFIPEVDGEMMELKDEVMLSHHAVGPGISVELRLEVEPDGRPIDVTVACGEWRETVRCLEGTKVEELKGMVGKEEGWSDEKRGRMELREGYLGIKMEDGRAVGEYLVVDGSTVELNFGDEDEEEE